MRVGTFCYATNQGLGILARQFHEAGIVTDPFVVRHPKHPTHSDWYPSCPMTPIRPLDVRLMQKFCLSVDLMLFFETPFDWTLIQYCRRHKIPTVLMTMYECTPWGIANDCEPDLYLCPSELDLRYFRDKKATHLPVPLPDDFPWRQRTTAQTFVHNAGNCGLLGRNGTKELMDALPLVKSPARFIVRFQERCCDSLGEGEMMLENGGRVSFRPGCADFGSLWEEGDVFIFPEKFNGLSLPLQEARAAGMLVMGTDRFPMNAWLPIEPLIPPAGFQRSRIGGAYMQFDEAIIDPEAIAAKIDSWYDRDITDYSRQGRDWADAHRWSRLKPKYLDLLERVKEGSV